MKPEKIIELTELMLQAQERYFKSGKNPALLSKAKTLEARVKKAIAKAKEETPALFVTDPHEADIPGTIETPQGGDAPILRFTPSMYAVTEQLRRLQTGKVTAVRIIIRPEE